MIRSTPRGVEIDVRVIPRAKKTECAGVREGALLVRLSAPPVEGAANEALIGLLARVLDVPRRAISILSGGRGRVKRLEIVGIGPEEVSARLSRL